MAVCQRRPGRVAECPRKRARDAPCAALDLEQRLVLFGQACEAVAYAHRHLVVHRDTTVRHDFDVLLAMNRESPSVIAKSGEQVCGYCLMMPRTFRSRVPELDPMFETLEQLAWRGVRLASSSRWFVMGQVCVAAGFRGRGVFDGMYRTLRDVYSADFDWVITEISHRNGRSLRAHRRVGFQTLLCHDAPAAAERWEVVVWDWSA